MKLPRLYKLQDKNKQKGVKSMKKALIISLLTVICGQALDWSDKISLKNY